MLWATFLDSSCVQSILALKYSNPECWFFILQTFCNRVLLLIFSEFPFLSHGVCISCGFKIVSVPFCFMDTNNLILGIQIQFIPHISTVSLVALASMHLVRRVRAACPGARRGAVPDFLVCNYPVH